MPPTIGAAIGFITSEQMPDFLSDKFGRRNILLASFTVFMVTYLGFVLTRNVVLIALLFIGYGFFQEIFRSIGKASARLAAHWPISTKHRAGQCRVTSCIVGYPPSFQKGSPDELPITESIANFIEFPLGLESTELLVQLIC